MSESLYGLLPAHIRIRDAEQGEPLRALLGIIQEQADRLEADIAGLYDDWFIETSREWVVPYIGDLLGVRLLHTVDREGLYSQRAFVANTLGYRRRKGTLLMLEDLARDVTGWDARGVAFFQQLGWTQHLNHLRMQEALNPDPANPERLNPPAVTRVGTVNLRAMDAVDRIGSAFDEVAHTVDVRRPPAGMLPPGWGGGASGSGAPGVDAGVLDTGVPAARSGEGWYNIRNLGFFLWRLQSYPLRGVTPAPSEDYADGFHFSPLGNPAPLFTNPARDEEAGHASEREVSGPIRPMAFFRDPEAWYGHGPDRSFALYRGERVDPAALIPVEEILCRDLSTWSPPPAGVVAVDVALGRFAFAPGETPEEGVTAVYHYGFSGDIGGGPYDRRGTLETGGEETWEVTVARHAPDPLPEEWRTSIADALADWDPTTHPRALITVADSATYDEVLELELEGAVQVTVQAGNRQRPVVRLRDGGGGLGEWILTGGNGADAGLTLDGLVLEGSLRVDAESVGRLELRHCTLVPGRALDEAGAPRFPHLPSLDVDGANPLLEITVERCITGALHVPAEIVSLTVRDSIVDRPAELEDVGPGEPPGDPVEPPADPVEPPPADPLAPAALFDRIALGADGTPTAPGAATTLERVTVLGDVRVEVLDLASEVVFAGAVRAERRQRGCVRFSYVDDLVSATPQRFRCQPDLALETRRRTVGVEEISPVEGGLIRSRMRPDFTSVRYGEPGYAQLALHTAPEVRTGSEDGAEMGVFETLKQPQREANLRTRLDEYMPFGLQAGLIYVT
jgi:hypothetical protein